MRVKLEEVCKRIYAGGDVPKDRYSEEKTGEYNIPIYANAEKDDGLYGYTDEARETELSITVAARGTIGFTAIRREPFLPVVRLITVVPDLNKVSERYLFYALKNCKPQSSGSSIPQLTVPDIKKNSINLLDISEQESIADRLDKVNGIIKLRTEEIAKLDELIKARFVELFGNIKEEQLLEDISEFVTVGIANSATHAYAESGIPMLRNQNIKENYLDDTDLIYIKPEFAAKYESKKLKENDIIAMRTGYPGIACLVPKKYEGCQTFTTLIVRLKAENNPSYVCSYINSDLGKRFIESGKVGVAQQNFGAKSLAKMPIKIAPKELQDEYADFVKQVDKSKVD